MWPYLQSAHRNFLSLSIAELGILFTPLPSLSPSLMVFALFPAARAIPGMTQGKRRECNSEPFLLLQLPPSYGFHDFSLKLALLTGFYFLSFQGSHILNPHKTTFQNLYPRLLKQYLKIGW